MLSFGLTKAIDAMTAISRNANCERKTDFRCKLNCKSVNALQDKKWRSKYTVQIESGKSSDYLRVRRVDTLDKFRKIIVEFLDLVQELHRFLRKFKGSTKRWSYIHMMFNMVMEEPKKYSLHSNLCGTLFFLVSPKKNVIFL